MGGSAGLSRRQPSISARAEASKFVTLCAKQGAPAERSEDWLSGNRTVGGPMCQWLIHGPLGSWDQD